MATSATVHSHAAPQGFIRKYIFSLDHKVIGLQYYFLALVAVFVGMFLSVLMRFHMIWPTAVLPIIGEIKPETYLSLLTMHGTIMVFFVLTTAPQGGFGNYFLPIQIGAPDMAFPVLNMLSFWTTFVAFVVILAAFFVTECADQFWPGRTIGRGFVDYQHCDFLYRLAHGSAEFHHDHA
jgi:cytochrome c oxidase subunit 1